ncbi:hypothetical protein F5I97DRAFT_1828232 [Phlebopus sp. FC_14]|nr:hypothetical protein F5I97DRAFT_1828232 [Phlebopus sp. FC_14]
MSVLAPTPRSPQPTSPSHPPSQSQSSPRPSSRSERLLRDTLRRDDTLRTSATTPRSDGEENDDEFFQPALLFRSARRGSAASATSHNHIRKTGAFVLGNGCDGSFYVPDENEDTSYAQLLRSSSFSGSSRSRDEHKAVQYPSFFQEKQEDTGFPCSYDAAPHEAVLRTRLERVLHRGMREVRREKGREAGTSSMESSTGSPPSSLCSLSNSRSHESEQTRLTTPEAEACVTSTPPMPSKDVAPARGGHRYTQSMPAAYASQPSVTQSPHRNTTRSSRVQSPRTPQPPRTPQTPRSTEESQKYRDPDSPWRSTPLPPSPAFSAEWGNRTSPLAASLACKQVPGYVSFASVAGLGEPPEEEDRRVGRRGFAGFNLGSGSNGGKGRVLGGLGLGSGKWWVF